MYHSNIELKEGAFIISDAHYSSSRPQLLNFLKDIESKKLLPTQLILMGDIFDALFGGIKKTYDENEKAIDIINKISKEIEVVYLEGNHDFNLEKLFPNSKVYKISQQPLMCKIEDKKVNLLFFGNFHKMPLLEYQWAMNELMKDREYLYNSLIKDLYFLGIVLNRKYKLLRITYTIFMIGIIVSIAAFWLAFQTVNI